MDFVKLFLSPNGRIGRLEFWIGFVILFAIDFALWKFAPFGRLVSLPLVYCWICLFAKRLHDYGQTGWWVLFPLAAVAAILFAAGIMFQFGVGVDLRYVVFLAIVIFWMWVGGSEGDHRENRHGAPPRLPVAV